MDLLDLIKLTFRRWYVTAPIVALTVVAAAGIGAAIRPEYRSTVAIVLVPPTGAAAPTPTPAAAPGNPWSRIGVGAMAQAVQIATSAHDARSRVRAGGGDPDYKVELVPRSSILTIEVAADSAGVALATVDGVTALVHDEIAGRQAQYRSAPGEQITAQVLDPGRDVTPSRSNVLRLQIVVVGIGLLVAAAAAVGHDAVARHRAAARTRQFPARHLEPEPKSKPAPGHGPDDRPGPSGDEAGEADDPPLAIRRSTAGSPR